jgi:hypothetical protein
MEEVKGGGGEECIMRNFITFTLHQILLKVIKSRRMTWVGHIARMGEMVNAYKIVAGKTEGERSLGKPRHIWKVILKLILGK